MVAGKDKDVGDSMDMEETETTQASLTEERLRLEREALAVERERLAAARAHAAAEARLTRAPHPVFVGVSVALLALLCFAGGLLTGIAVMENRQQRQREERLARALSQLDGLAAAEAGFANEEQLKAAGVPAGLVRMSCGLESKEDLIEDIAQALEAI